MSLLDLPYLYLLPGWPLGVHSLQTPHITSAEGRGEAPFGELVPSVKCLLCK